MRPRLLYLSDSGVPQLDSFTVVNTEPQLENYLTFTFPKTSAVSVTGFIDTWVKENAEDNPAVTIRRLDDRALQPLMNRLIDEHGAEDSMKGQAVFQFLFPSSAESYLEIEVSESRRSATEQTVTLRKRQFISPMNPQVAGLLRFAAQSILDSLANDIGEMVVQLLSREKYTEPSVVSESTSMPLTALSADAPEPILPHTSEQSTSGALPEVVFTWVESTMNAQTGKSLLLLWSEKFANRGAGITTESVDDGLLVDFAIADGFKLLFRVETVAGVTAIVRELLVDEAVPEKERSLLDMAVENLSSSLAKFLDSYQMPEPPPQEIGAEEPVLYEDQLQASFVTATEASKAASARPQLQPKQSTARDPQLRVAAKEAGIDLDKFEGRGLEEQAVQQLKDLMDSSKKEGYVAALATFREEYKNSSSVAANVTLGELFETGSKMSKLSWEDMLKRKYTVDEDLSVPPTKLPVISLSGLEMGVDIFEGPPLDIIANAPLSSVEGQQRAAAAMLTPPDVTTYAEDLQRMQFLISELVNSPEEVHTDILDSFRDVLLCDNLVFIMRQLNATQSDWKTRQTCMKIVDSAKLLTAELGVLAKTESIRHLETIHDICEISSKYQHDDIRFLEELDYIKPRFDSAFLSYLKFAIAEERQAIVSRGSDPDRLPSTWLQVLKVVYQGVLAEFEIRFSRLMEQLFIVVRFDQPELRRSLLASFINSTVPLELQYLKELTVNMVLSILATPADQLPDATLIPRMRQLKEDIATYLPDELIDERVKAFVESCAKQGKRVVMRHRNPVLQLEIDLETEYGSSSLDNQVSESVLDKYKR